MSTTMSKAKKWCFSDLVPVLKGKKSKLYSSNILNLTFNTGKEPVVVLYPERTTFRPENLLNNLLAAFGT